MRNWLEHVSRMLYSAAFNLGVFCQRLNVKLYTCSASHSAQRPVISATLLASAALPLGSPWRQSAQRTGSGVL